MVKRKRKNIFFDNFKSRQKVKKTITVIRGKAVSAKLFDPFPMILWESKTKTEAPNQNPWDFQSLVSPLA